MVPTLLSTHEHHVRAVAALTARLDAGDTMVIIGHTLLETYSTLTRMPPPTRVSPTLALQSVTGTFLTIGQVVSLTPVQYVELLSTLMSDGILGGQVYDAAIVACARRAGVTELLTFNERHFRRFEGNGLTIVVP